MVELKGPRQDVKAPKQSYNEKPFLPLGLKRQGEEAVTAGARMVSCPAEAVVMEYHR